MIAARVQHIEASGIRKMFELVSTMEDPINLSIGQAHFDPPQELRQAAARAIEKGWNRYSVTQGVPELNELVMQEYLAKQGREPEASMVTCGVSGGVLLSFLCLLDPGDEILLPDPYFMMYRHLAILCGAVPRYYSLYPDFKLPLAEIGSLLTEKTKIILVNTPSNPTGALFSTSDLEAVGRMADEAGAVMISDEIYDQFVYDQEFVSPGRFSRQALILGGFSKTYGIPGWRLGYALGPDEIIDRMRTLQQFTFVCAPTPLQHALVETWGIDMSGWIDQYRQKRDLVASRLAPEFKLVKPGGSFYAFPSFPEGTDPKEIHGKALERKLLFVPGAAFSSRSTHFRISFAAEDNKLEEGLDLLNELARG